MKQKKKLMVFDMDGVIMEVSNSYRDTVRKTARLFFKGACAWKDLPDPLFSLSDLSHVKHSGGLNNDWDLTCRVIHLLFFHVKAPPRYEYEDRHGKANHKETISACDVSDLAKYLASTNRPLSKLLKQQEKPHHPFVAAMYTGDVENGNIIKRIFQEIYLGTVLFESTYKVPPEYYKGDGLINREKLLVNPSILEKLSRENILAIATGRPQAEADHSLNLHDIREYFKTVFTLDQCLKKEKIILKTEGRNISLSKPHPFMLDAVFHAVQQNNISHCYYVGDMPDDMIAATRSKAGFIGVGFVLAASEKQNLRQHLLQAGATYVVEGFEELERL